MEQGASGATQGGAFVCLREDSEVMSNSAFAKPDADSLGYDSG